MTNEEFNRYEQAKELKDKIDNLEHDLNNLNDVFDKDSYPRSESSWELSIVLNDKHKIVQLDSDIFWACIDLVKEYKLQKINKLKKQFEDL